MPDQSPKNLQFIVNHAFHDLSGPLNNLHSYVDFLAEAHEQQDEEMTKMCVQGLTRSSTVVRAIFQMMHDQYFTEGE